VNVHSSTRHVARMEGMGIEYKRSVARRGWHMVL